MPPLERLFSCWRVANPSDARHLEEATVRHLQHPHVEVCIVHEVDAPKVEVAERAKAVARVPNTVA